ncbi:MAG: hypothetical protein C4520_21350 [Candidatus Abyssobacteria bacterium SURF_5]|uniref:Uncharacterized protein n=1 Tax=Abyssobacteria bacterium (strain SURF_5) TaxID=2093360 RepID=A0A3A4NHK2_ABYX5|nr:MAG: hypothetical protein C4520_21350 [Candidatus Abyssubacteria bacterium SURF_5]
MPSKNNQEQWPEHAVCARCAAPLTDDYRESPLGLRFCKDCFDGTVQEKVRERAALIYVKGRCSKCGKSLINGYRLNQFGVIYCLSCSDSPSKPASESVAGEQNPDEKSDTGRAATPLEYLLVVSIMVSHLLFFLDFLLAGRLLRGETFFRPLVALDLVALILLVISRRFSSSWFSILWSLLLVAGYIILVLGEIVTFIQQ